MLNRSLRCRRVIKNNAGKVIFVYVFPQLIVALYFKARSTHNKALKTSFTIGLFVITIGMMVGIAAASMGMWAPRI